MRIPIRRMLTQLIHAGRYCVRLRGSRDDVPGPLPTMVTAWGAVVGFVLCAVFAASWKYFGDIYFTEYTRLRVVPSVMVLLTLTIVNFKQILGLAVTADRVFWRRPADPVDAQDAAKEISIVGIITVVLALLLKFSVLLAMPYHTPWWPNDWRRIFNRVYPKMYYRVLMLTALWGKVGLLIAAATGSQSPSMEPQDRAFRNRLRVRTLLFNVGIVGLLTTVYFSSTESRTLGLLVSLSIFMLVYLASMFVSTRQAGHDRYSMAACAELGELALLLGYMAISRFLYRP